MKLASSFAVQADWADRLGSVFTAGLMRRGAAEVERGGVITALIGDWPGDPIADGLPLRFSAALHALVLAGEEPALAALYPPRAADIDIDAVWRAAETAMAARPAHFAAYLATAPQTNEVRRAALLLPGFVAIARHAGRPLRLLEIGASAGLNTIWDSYRYRYGERRWGDPTSPLKIACEWRGAPFDLGGPVPVASRAACDRSPIDIADPAQRARLRAYIWPDQADRLARLDDALAVALATGVRVDRADAADWLDAELTESAEDFIPVMYHSVVWQYLPAQTRKRVQDRLDAVGQRRPLAWLALEFAGEDYELHLTLWPGDGHKTKKLLARTHPHGEWLDWLGEEPQEVDR